MLRMNATVRPFEANQLLTDAAKETENVFFREPVAEAELFRYELH